MNTFNDWAKFYVGYARMLGFIQGALPDVDVSQFEKLLANVNPGALPDDLGIEKESNKKLLPDGSSKVK